MPPLRYIVTLALLLCASSRLFATFTITPTPLFESVGITTSYADSSATATVQYRESGGTWKDAYPLVWDPNTSQFAGSIVNLEEEKSYEVRVTFFNSGVQDDQEVASFTTWSSSPPIDPAKTYSITDIYNPSTDTQLFIPQSMSGTENGWAKIVGDGTTVIDAAYLEKEAVLIESWSSYLILENLIIRGGIINGIKTSNSSNIRIINCDIAGWGRQPESAPRSNGRWYSEAGYLINYDSAIYLQQGGQSVVERCYVHDPRSTANAWSDGPGGGGNHPNGTNAFFASGNHSTATRKGQIIVRYNDFVGSDAKRWNDVIEGYSNGSASGGFVRDSDIYGNYLAFGNDDGAEIDGGQINVKFYRNRIEGTYTGVSVAPTMRGPSYVFQNLFVNLGDIHAKRNTNIKAGFGTPAVPSPFFAFNNTGYNAALGIGGSSGKYRTTTRNNLFYTRSSWDGYRWGVSDTYADPLSSYDYDLLANSALGTGQIKYGSLINAATGMETNGILYQLPEFSSLADGDYRLQTGSAGVDQGQILPNFSDGYLGSAPDMGAMESGGTSMLPYRPINQRTDVQEVHLGYIANELSSAQFVEVTNPDAAIGFKVLKNDASDWLVVSPSSGTLPAGGSLSLVVSIDPDLAPLRTPASYNSNAPDGQVRGAFLIKLANGYSIPVSVYGKETQHVVRINCGTSDVGEWESDQASNYTSSGSVGTVTTAIDLSGVTDPAPEAVYQSGRWASGTSPIKENITGLIPNAAYTVRLHFAEIAAAHQSPGSRVFDVNINQGPIELDDYNIFNAAGAGYKAVVAEFSAISDPLGTIDIEFSYQNASPWCSGIELILNPLSGTPTEVAIDNTDPTGVIQTGTWATGTYASGYYGSDYLHDLNTEKGTKSIRFTPFLAAGNYDVFARWTSASNRASNTPIDITHAGGTTSLTVDQRSNGGQWVLLGTYSFATGTSGSVLIQTTGTNGYVIADAVRFTPVHEEVIVDTSDITAVSFTGTWLSSTLVPGYYGSDYMHDQNLDKGTKSVTFTPDLANGGSYEVFARWIANNTRADNVPINIAHAGGVSTVTVNQRLNGSQWVSLGTYTFNPGTNNSVTISNTGTNGYVIADAIKWSRTN